MPRRGVLAGLLDNQIFLCRAVLPPRSRECRNGHILRQRGGRSPTHPMRGVFSPHQEFDEIYAIGGRQPCHAMSRLGKQPSRGSPFLRDRRRVPQPP